MMREVFPKMACRWCDRMTPINEVCVCDDAQIQHEAFLSLQSVEYKGENCEECPECACCVVCEGHDVTCSDYEGDEDCGD